MEGLFPGWKESPDALLLEGVDASDPQAVERAVGEVLSRFDHIDVLVNTVGGYRAGTPVHETSLETWDFMLNLNARTAFVVSRAVIPNMLERGRGKIINIASIAGLVGRDRRMYQRHGLRGQPVDYAAAKAGIIGLTRDLAGLLSPMGVHVNAISPGGFARENLPAGFIQDYSDRTPLGRMGREGVDLKGAVLFLASAASDYITGHNLVVDGGFSVWQ